MRFSQKIAKELVPEWRDYYFRYSYLKKQIKKIKARLFSMALHVEISGIQRPNYLHPETGEILIENLKEEKAFWILIDQEIKKVNEFYKAQIIKLEEQFLALIAKTFQKNLLPNFEPLKYTRFERELERQRKKIFGKEADNEDEEANTDNENDVLEEKEEKKEKKEHEAKDKKEFFDQNEMELPHLESNDHLSIDVMHNSQTEILSKVEPNSGDPNDNQSEGLTSNTLRDSLRLSQLSQPKEPPETNKKSLERTISSYSLDSNLTPFLQKRMNHRKNQAALAALQELKSEKEVNLLSTKALKKAYSDYYLSLLLLQNFVYLNSEALRKIAKKHVKNLGQSKGYETYKRAKERTFSKHQKLDILMNETEIYARAFTNCQRTKAMSELRSSHAGYSGKEITNTNFYLGLNLGLFVSLVFLIIYVGSLHPAYDFPRFKSVMQVYRMLAMIVLMLWLWGLDMLIWNYYRVNYVLILEFDPRNHVLHQHMFLAASIFSNIWAISLLIYLTSALDYPGFEWLGYIPWQVHPLTLIGIYLCSLTFFQIKSEYWLLRTMKRLLMSPFSPVLFQDTFLGDQFVSIVIVLTDIEFTLCFFLYDAWANADQCNISVQPYAKPFFAVLPMLWRLFQCLRRYKDTRVRDHLFNAGKYTATLSVTFFSTITSSNFHSPFFYCWLLSAVVNTGYCYYWDVFKDWGLEGIRAVRSKIVYPKNIYRFVIVIDLVLRLMWTLTVSPATIGIFLDPLIFATILAGVEIYRRAQWNVFRVENEHLNNKKRLKAVKDLPINVDSYRGHFDEIKQTITGNFTQTPPPAITIHTRSTLESKRKNFRNVFSDPPTKKTKLQMFESIF